MQRVIVEGGYINLLVSESCSKSDAVEHTILTTPRYVNSTSLFGHVTMEKLRQFNVTSRCVCRQ